MVVLKYVFCVFYEWYNKRYPRVRNTFEYACMFILVLFLPPTSLIYYFVKRSILHLIATEVTTLDKLFLILLTILLWFVILKLFDKGKYHFYLYDYSLMSRFKKSLLKIFVWGILLLEIAGLFYINSIGGIAKFSLHQLIKDLY